MTKKQRKRLVRILAALALFIVVLFLPLQGVPQLLAYLAVYLFIGGDILWRAVRNILRGQVFDENFLMSVATVGAFALGDYKEGIAVMLFYQVGEWFQSYAVGRSRRSIAALMDIRPDHANLLLEDGSLSQLAPEEVDSGSRIVIKPGERVPLDGIVEEGSSSLDTSALTGESLPRETEKGGEVISGSINLTGLLTVRVTKTYGQSTVARILELVESSGQRKSKAENFITKFARYYTPAVCLAALVLALLPPLLLGQSFGVWVYRALTFLVISCPCALVISIPMSIFGGIGGASKAGVLIKGGNYLEALAKADTLVFDKTGTLTEGKFVVTQQKPVGVSADELLQWAAYAEQYSNHPIAQSVREAYGKTVQTQRITSAEELAGFGVRAVVDGAEVLVGNAKLMAEYEIDMGEAARQGGTVIHVAREGRYVGSLLAEDLPKPDAIEAVADLRRLGVKQMVMLTGDSAEAGQKVAEGLGLDGAYTGLLPQDKVEKVEQMLEGERTGTLAFVGDGVNDAPVLARADVGIAMGGLGSDAAIEAADIVIMTDEPAKIPTAIRISRKTVSIVRQNIVFALGVKGIVLILGALGFASMWAAVFADVGVAFLAILNAMRALYIEKAPAENQTAQLQRKVP
ncbi:cadmium-translocating P-type ATPase [Ruminococcaceae bacterium OttesenSCG-928-I18]|nr:cadmium-translocating P-type ATPase [Ruminococcaceae bacterium OttesenSCG-928-I18]